MSTSNQLTDPQRATILTGHHAFGRREMVRHWMLSQQDLDFVNERRRQQKLGFAVQLCLLHYPGWPLKPDEIPPANLLQFVSEQLAVNPEEIREYAKRDATRVEHLRLLANAYGFCGYYPPHPQQLREHVRHQALATDTAFTLVQDALDWLRSRKVIPRWRCRLWKRWRVRFAGSWSE
jgi:hypothetical protein